MEETKKIELLEKIDSYIKGKLSQEEIEALWIDFLKYPEMFRYFDTEVQIQDMIKNGDVPESFRQYRVEEPEQPGTSYKVWFYAAAAALIFAIGLQFFSIQQQDVNASKWAVDEIELDEMVGSDVYRSVEDGEILETDLQINSAMAMAYSDSIEAAIESYRELLINDLNDRQLARVELNIGILLYNNGSYEEAKSHFERVTRIETVRESFIEKGWWLYGNALLNTGDIAEARQAVYTAYGMNGRFQKPALALLKKLDAELLNNSSGKEQTSQN
jgi:tetratricopeptide (TPR) repeat protein